MVGFAANTKAPDKVPPDKLSLRLSAVSTYNLWVASVFADGVNKFVIFLEFILTSALGAVIAFNATVFK